MEQYSNNNDNIYIQRIQELEESNRKLLNKVNELDMLNNNLKNQLEYFQTKFLESNLMDDSKDISSCLSDLYNSLNFDSSTAILGSDNTANSTMDGSSGDEELSPRSNLFKPISNDLGSSTSNDSNNISPDSDLKKSTPPQQTTWSTAYIPKTRSDSILQQSKVHVTFNPQDSVYLNRVINGTNRDTLNNSRDTINLSNTQDLSTTTTTPTTNSNAPPGGLLSHIKKHAIPPLPPGADKSRSITSPFPTSNNPKNNNILVRSPSASASVGPRPSTPPVINGESSGDLSSLVTAATEDDQDRLDDPNLILVKNEAGNYIVKGGTLDKLVQRLSYEGSHDIDFSAAFLLTYRSFTTPFELLDQLIGNYNAPIDEENTRNKNKKKIIRLRVANIIKKWLDRYFHDFQAHPELLAKMDQFVTSQILVDMESIGRNLKKLLSNERATHTIVNSIPPPTPIIPKKSSVGGEFCFKDFDPLEVARQLTIIEAELYRKIESKECLNQSWNKADKEERAPNIFAIIKRFNVVSTWVATEILQQDKLKDRASVIKKFLQIADRCRELGNFNGLMEIISGLQNSSVHRLRKSWEKIESKPELKSLYDDLLLKTSSKCSYKEYRTMLHNVHPPCIPYAGIYLTDLTFIEEGNKNTLNNRDDLINFEKRRKISVVIREIQQYQQQSYNLEVEENIMKYLKQLPNLTDQALYKLSLICEPREIRASIDGNQNTSVNNTNTTNITNTSSSSLTNSVSFSSSNTQPTLTTSIKKENSLK